MKRLCKENAVFLLIYFIFLVVGVFLVLCKSKSTIHLSINEFHTPLFDLLFKTITWLGSGWMVLILLIILLFINYRHSLVFLVSNLLITLVVQVGKHLLFPHTLRPVEWFKENANLYLVPGVSVHSFHSFPSGHAATAFGLFFMLCLLTPRHFIKGLWVSLALLTAFSRVYLSQHFLIDIIGGSLIGLFITFFTYYYFSKFASDKFNGSLIQTKEQTI